MRVGEPVADAAVVDTRAASGMDTSTRTLTVTVAPSAGRLDASGATYDAATGQERLRIGVTLATQIPLEVCESINVGYLDPATIDIEAWRADPEVTVVDNAGEILFRPAG